MADLIAIVGDTGTGKSYALRTLDPKETVIISCWNKVLSFKGARKKYTPLSPTSGNHLVAKKGGVLPYKVIGDVLNDINTKRPEIKVIVLDDFQYLMAGEFMDKAEITGWQKFTEMALHVYNLLTQAASLRDDLVIIVSTHDEKVDTPDFKSIRKIKTIGKMLDEKITLEGLFTLVLFTEQKTDNISKETSYQLLTQNDGTARAKSPAGMFERLIPNDAKFVVDRFHEFYMEED